MSPRPLIRKPWLCYVTDRRLFADDPDSASRILLRTVERAAKAGVDCIQLREKDLSAQELAGLARAAKDRIEGNTRLLVNDRLDVACAVEAGGVHLGGRSLPVSAARRFMEQRCAGREFLLGVSAHSLRAALEAEKDGADYVIFGPVFATPSKSGFGAPQGLARLREVCNVVEIPVLAIGGINLANFNDCMQAGATGIAAIRLFQDAQNLTELVVRMRNAT